MRKNKILQSIRVESELYNQMIDLIKILNENNDDGRPQIQLSDFRRMAYKYFLDRVKSEGLELIWKFKK